jgi:hypothetical protein
MIRHTETRKWEDPWFCELSVEAKLLFHYLCDAVDNAGFIEMNLRLWCFHTGLSSVKEPLAELSQVKGDGTYSVLVNGLWIWLPNFVRVQSNWPINPKNRAHTQIVKLMKAQQERFMSVDAFMAMLREIPDMDTPSVAGELPTASREDLRHATKDWTAIREQCVSTCKFRTVQEVFDALMKWWDHRMTIGDPLEVPMWQQLNSECEQHHPDDIVNAINYSIANGMKGLNFTMAKKIRLDQTPDTPPPANTVSKKEPATDWKAIMKAKYPEAKIPNSFWNLPPSTQRELKAESSELRKELEG